MQAMMSKALGSFKQVGFLCFMMWMSGSQIHLFSIMMLVTGIYQPFSTLFSVNQGITLLCYSALSTPQHPAAWLQLTWMHGSNQHVPSSMLCLCQQVPADFVCHLQLSLKTKQVSWSF